MELKPRIKQQSESVMRAAVQEVESGLTRQEVAEKYGIAYSTILKWLSRFASKEFRMIKQIKFSDQQKRFIVKKIQDGDLTIEEARLSSGLRNTYTLKKWIKELNASIGDIDSNELPMPISNVASLDLKKALDQANLKVLALETMIDVAEEQFKIKIRKKAGAKQ